MGDKFQQHQRCRHFPQRQLYNILLGVLLLVASLRKVLFPFPAMQPLQSASYSYTKRPSTKDDVMKETMPSKNILSPSTSLPQTQNPASPVKNAPDHTDRTAWLNPHRMADHLELVHIPKTGGTAIEIAAARQGIPWGFCQFEMEFIPFWLDPPIPDDLPHCPVVSNRTWKNNQIKNLFRPIEAWRINVYHTPPCILLQHLNNCLYHEKALFAVVRHPYDRIQSDFYYWADRRNWTVDSMNEWIEQQLEPLQFMPRWREKIPICTDRAISQNVNVTIHPPGRRPSTFYALGNHLIPQYDFIFGGRPAFFESRIVHHVLFFDSLAHDFATLMQIYNLSTVKLPHRGAPTTANANTLQRSALSEENKKRIQRLYRDDFVVFGFQP